MSVFQGVIKDLQGLYPDLKLDESGKSARKPVTTKLDLVIYEDKQPPEWEAVDKKTKAATLVKDVTGVPKLIILEFVSVFNEFKEEAVKKASIENLKEGGFDISDEPVKAPEEPENKAEEVIQEPLSDAEKLEKLEAIMNGEIEPVRTPAKRERQVKKMPAIIPVDMRAKQIQELTIQDIKDYICPTATEQEAFMFLKLCQARNLNPFLNEAYLIKYGDKTTMTVGKEAFMRRAEAHPQFDGFEAGIIIQKPDGELERREGTFMLKNETLVGGWAKIYRKDRRQPFVSEVALHEYDLKKALWVSKPATMIRKVAIVQGKREAFPSEFGGMYDKAEVDTGIIDAEYMEVEA